MPQCAVYIYEDTLTSISSRTIEILETNYSGVKLDIQWGATMGSEFGANINLPNPPEPINIWIDDTSGYFSPAALGQLNGQVISRLDVIVYALPVLPGGGRGPGGPGATWQVSRDNQRDDTDFGVYSDSDSYVAKSLDSIASHISQQVESENWSDSEAMGVRNLLDSATRALNCPQLDEELQNKLERWRQQLKSLGIEIPEHIGLIKGHSQGGSGLMGASS